MTRVVFRKGFLGRVFADNSDQPVTSFEYQKALCDLERREADGPNLPMTFVQDHALSPEAISIFNPNQHAVALYSYGDLRVSLIEKAMSVGLPALTLSPRCYHLTQEYKYQALSSYGQLSELKLSRSELRIPLQ